MKDYLLVAAIILAFLVLVALRMQWLNIPSG